MKTAQYKFLKLLLLNYRQRKPTVRGIMTGTAERISKWEGGGAENERRRREFVGGSGGIPPPPRKFVFSILREILLEIISLDKA